MADLENIVFEKAQLKVIPVETFEGYNWQDEEAAFHGCYGPERITRNEYEVLFQTILREHKEVLDPFVVILQVQILPLVDNKLEVDFDVRQLFHSLERGSVFALAELLQEFFDRLVQNRLYMVDDELQHFVMHF